MRVTCTAAQWLAMANWAERKANEAAASEKPWALRNLRLYQNKMNEYLAHHYVAVRLEQGTPFAV